MAEKYITYEALNFEGISRKPNYRIIGFSEDMLYACDRKESAALVYHVIFRWSERRRDEILVENQRRSKQGLALLSNEDVGERMWIYMSYLDFARELGGAVAYNTIISALHFLVDCKHFLQRRANHDPRFGDYEYRINGAVVRKALQALPLFPPPYTRAGRGGKQSKGTETGTPSISGTKFGTEGTKTGVHHRVPQNLPQESPQRGLAMRLTPISHLPLSLFPLSLPL
jgi:hypothetical protein